jgi:hypothetical protein
MALIDLDKTSYKFKDVLWFIGGALFFSGGVWRFESNMSDLKESQEVLRKEIIYNYTIEIMKINSRIDLLEAKKIVQFRSLKKDTLEVNKVNLVDNQRTKNGKDKQEKYPQVCMVIPRQLELRKLKLPNIKKLKET